MLWPRNTYNVLIETTTYCNAKCPQCSRTNPDGLEYSNVSPLKHITMRDWQESYARSYDKIHHFHFSGQWGDAFMNPDQKDIMYDIIDNSEASISFSTNGSMRDGDYWWDIGAKCKGRVHGVFDVDGATQESHEFYRRNTNLQLVKDNAEAFAATGASTRIFSLVFKHNQNEIEEIAEWAKSIGARHDFMQSNRFKRDTFSKYRYKGVEYTLEQTDDPRYKNTYHKDRIIRDHRHKKIERSEIDCHWGKDNKVFVDINLNVWPCCYWHANTYVGALPAGQPPSPVYKSYLDKMAEGKFNLKVKTIDEIMSDSFFGGDLENSFTNKPQPLCNFMCGNLKSD